MVCSKDLRRPGDRVRTPEIARLKITSEPTSTRKHKQVVSHFCQGFAARSQRSGQVVPVLSVSLVRECQHLRAGESGPGGEMCRDGRQWRAQQHLLCGPASRVPWGEVTVWVWCGHYLINVNQIDSLLEKHNPDAVVVVMAVDDFSSYLLAQSIIEKLSR